MLETYSDYATKYDSPMAYYVDCLDGGEDDSYQSGDTEGFALYGKRILSWYEDGFVELNKFETKEAAADRFNERVTYWEHMQDIACAAQGCTPDPDGAFDTDGSHHVIGCVRDWIG